MTELGWATTAAEALAGHRLEGRRALVTGASAGLGVETARALAAQGCTVIAAVRNLEKAQAATRDLREQFGDRFRLTELDLASLASVRACADRLSDEGALFDVVIANAGVMATPFARTVDGFETQIGVNHLGHFVLINRLARLIAPGGRIVTLSSVAHHFSDIDLDDVNFTGRAYDPVAAYGASKTAGVLFSVECDRRWRERGVRAVAVHPGGIATELARYITPELSNQMIAMMMADAGGSPDDARFKSVEQGAATSVWAAFAADPDVVGGAYCEDCGVGVVAETGGAGVRPYAIDPERAARLWSISEAMVGERFA